MGSRHTADRHTVGEAEVRSHSHLAVEVESSRIRSVGDSPVEDTVVEAAHRILPLRGIAVQGSLTWCCQGYAQLMSRNTLLV